MLYSPDQLDGEVDVDMISDGESSLTSLSSDEDDNQPNLFASPREKGNHKDDSDGNAISTSLESNLALQQEELHSITQDLEDAKTTAKGATRDASNAKKKKNKAQKELNSLCSKARNEVRC